MNYTIQSAPITYDRPVEVPMSSIPSNPQTVEMPPVYQVQPVPVEVLPINPGEVVKPIPTSIPQQSTAAPGDPLTTFLMEPQFYLRVRDFKSCGTYEFDVFPSDYYGQPLYDCEPICELSLSEGLQKGIFSINNMVYDIDKKTINSTYRILNRTTGSKLCTIEFSSGCCRVGFKIEFPGVNRIFNGRMMINGNESCAVIDEGRGMGTISMIEGESCQIPTTVLVIPASKPDASLDALTIRSMYIALAGILYSTTIQGQA